MHPAIERVKVDMLPSYQERIPPPESQIFGILRRVFHGHDAHVLFLMSASMTNGLAEAISTCVQTIGQKNRLKILNLYQLGSSKTNECLCDLSSVTFSGQKVRYGNAIDADEVNSSVLLPIDARLYFPLMQIEHQVRIKKQYAESSLPAIIELDTAAAISVHRDHTEKNRVVRHHAVHVDIAVLLRQSASFKNSYRQKIEEIRRRTTGQFGPDLLVAPNHEASEALVDFASENLWPTLPAEERKSRICFHDSLDPTDASPAGAIATARVRGLSSSSTLLIIDDVVITGRRISLYQKHLRDLGYQGRVTFLVALRRPSNDVRLNELLAKLQHGGQIEFISVQELVLPDWHEEDCPWCKEIRHYDNLTTLRLSTPELIRVRRQALASSKATGIRRDAFCKIALNKDLSVGPGSFFVREGGSHAAIFASVASAVQKLRNAPAPDTLAPTHYPLAPVLKWTEHLKDTYTDSGLRVAFLRAAKKSELRSIAPTTESERQNAVYQLLRSRTADEKNLAWELLLDASMANDRIAPSSIGSAIQIPPECATLFNFLFGDNLVPVTLEVAKQRSLRHFLAGLKMWLKNLI